jgi:hypothetical protein
VPWWFWVQNGGLDENAWNNFFNGWTNDPWVLSANYLTSVEANVIVLAHRSHILVISAANTACQYVEPTPGNQTRCSACLPVQNANFTTPGETFDAPGSCGFECAARDFFKLGSGGCCSDNSYVEPCEGGVCNVSASVGCPCAPGFDPDPVLSGMANRPVCIA